MQNWVLFEWKDQGGYLKALKVLWLKKKKNQLGIQKIKIWRKLSSWAGGHTPILF